MQIELLGGPCDGQVFEVPDETVVWGVVQPVMTAAEFVAAEERPSLMEFAGRKPREFAYEKTQRRSFSGLWMFRYVGERVEK